MRVCSDHTGHMAIAVQRTKRKTTAIITNGIRRHKVFFNIEFDAKYKIIPEDPVKIAAIWLQSNIKMTERVKKELQMIIEVRRGKVVGKHEDGSAPEAVEGTTQYDGPEALGASNTPKKLASLYRNITGTDPTYADKPALIALTWDSMLNYEIPVKAEKVAGEKTVGVPVNHTYTFMKDAEKLPTQAQQILTIIKEAGSISRADLLTAMEGVVVTKQTQARILGFYEPKLKDYVTTA